MGIILNAICLCGYTRNDIFYGSGMHSLTTRYFPEPAYCDNCGTLHSFSQNTHFNKCPICREKVLFYKELSEEHKDADGEKISTKVYIIQASFHCPVCKKKELKFHDCGIWD